MRQQLIKFRTMQVNGLRGLLTEYGEVMAVGRSALNKAMTDVLARLSERLPAMLVNTLRAQWSRLGELDVQIAEIERRLSEWMKERWRREFGQVGKWKKLGSESAIMAGKQEPRNDET
jgi:transposase